MCEKIGYLREATLDDMDLLFEWVNEEGARKSAFLSEFILYEDHKKWFHDLLQRKDCKQYIYMNADEPIGEIRITILDETIAEISYSICESKRCMGYGKLLLQLLEVNIREEFPQINKLVGKVKPDNIASQKTFIDAGYSEIYHAFELTINKEIAIDVDKGRCKKGGGYCSSQIIEMQ